MQRFDNIEDIGREVKLARMLIEKFGKEGKDTHVVALLKAMPSLMREYNIQAERDKIHLHRDVLFEWCTELLKILTEEIGNFLEGTARADFIDRIRPRIIQSAVGLGKPKQSQVIEYHATTDTDPADDDQPENGD